MKNLQEDGGARASDNTEYMLQETVDIVNYRAFDYYNEKACILNSADLKELQFVQLIIILKYC